MVGTVTQLMPRNAALIFAASDGCRYVYSPGNPDTALPLEVGDQVMFSSDDDGFAVDLQHLSRKTEDDIVAIA